MNYGQMRWREEQPTCHLSLGWWREADYDVHYHPSVRFWRGVCHHGWAKGKGNTSTLSAMRRESLCRLRPFLSGIGRVARATRFVAGKTSPSLPDLPVLVCWCVWQKLQKVKYVLFSETQNSFWYFLLSELARWPFLLDSGSFKCPISAGLSPVLQVSGR